MKTAIVIPTLNAVVRGRWQEVLSSLAVQSMTMTVDRKLVIDSSSSDSTCAVAEAAGWEIRRIPRAEFNHGLTRDSIVRQLAANGYDTVVFLSQDVVLATPDALVKITQFLWNHPVAGCYGKQICLHERTLNAWQRLRCYPPVSCTRSLKNAPEYGMMTPFFSNAFSAWKVSEVIRFGGFPETDFGEDMLFAASVLNQGGSIGYCAEAAAIHDHPNTPWSLFSRGMQIGAFHTQHPELLRQFEKKKEKQHFLKTAPVSIWPAIFVKAAGYAFGRAPEKLVPLSLFLLMWILLIPAIFLYDFPQRDLVTRYAPMAEAFARGDWTFAFHPRVTPLLTFLSGSIAFLFSCGGYPACQFGACLLLSLSIFPFYSGCRKIYGFQNAVLSGLLFAVCSPLLRLGYYGLRETGSILGVSILFYAAAVLYRDHEKLSGAGWFTAAECLLLLSRGDLALFAAAAFAIFFLWDVFFHHYAWRTLVAGVLILLVLSPLLAYNYRMIGYPVPEVRHAVVLRKICHAFPVLECLENPHPVIPLDIHSVPNVSNAKERKK